MEQCLFYESSGEASAAIYKAYLDLVASLSENVIFLYDISILDLFCLLCGHIK